MSFVAPTTAPLRSLLALCLALSLAIGCGGGDGGGTAPPTVASVVIVTPVAPQSLQTLTRTVQFAAVARDASSTPIPAATITWSSSNSAAATVSGTGLVTAVANGSTQITASASGITSTALVVTVAQVVANVNATPAAVAFGAIGSTRQLAATVVDSSGAVVAGAPAVTWTRAGAGTTATVSAGGLATAVAVGAADTAVATASGRTARIPIAVTQVIASVVVSPSALDTLRTTGRTKQFTAAARDSLGNAIGGAAITWSSSLAGTATVSANTGLATAVADGTANIIATGGAVSGQRALVVQRYASTFSMSPPSATITTALGTQIFLGSATDSVTTALPITWATRTPTVLGLNAASGTQVTASAVSNGSSYVVMTAGTRRDSALVTVSGQAVAPLTATVIVGPGNLFRSQLNLTENPAVDTIRVGGTVTWQGQGGSHSTFSTGSPSFTNSGILGSGTYMFTFNAAGTYQYECGIHGSSMTGRVVVR